MKNKQINIINNFNLFIQQYQEKEASQNTPPQGQRLRDVFSQYHQVLSTSQPQELKESEDHNLRRELLRLMHAQTKPIEGGFDLEVLEFLDCDCSSDDLLIIIRHLRWLAYIKKYMRTRTTK